MQPPSTDAFTVATTLARALDRASIPYAIGGAIAFGIWGDPRGTYDVDINLFVNHGELDHALDVLTEAGVVVDRNAARIADAEGDVIVGRFGGLRVDLFTPSIPFAQEARRTAVRLEGPNGPANFLSAEAIAVFKLLFFRPKDQLDVEKLLAVQGDSLDTQNIRHWLVEMMGADDERVVALDAMLARRHELTG